MNDAPKGLWVEGRDISDRDGWMHPAVFAREYSGRSLIHYVRGDIHDEAEQQLRRLLKAAKQVAEVGDKPRAMDRLEAAIAECEGGEP